MALSFFTIPMAFACILRLIYGLKDPAPDLFTESALFVGTAGWSCVIWLLINIIF